MEFKNTYIRHCQDVKYKGPIPAVLKHIKDAVVAVDVDDFLSVRDHVSSFQIPHNVAGGAGAIDHIY